MRFVNLKAVILKFKITFHIFRELACIQTQERHFFSISYGLKTPIIWKSTYYCMGCNALWSSGSPPTFQRNILLHLQDSRVSQARIQKQADDKQRKPSNYSCCLDAVSVVLGSFFDHEDGGSAFLQNVSGLLLEYMT
jgi:hypothetical protein